MTSTLLQKEVEQYLRQVRGGLVCPHAQRKKTVCSLAGDIEGYLETHPGADMEQVQAHFGTPQKITEEMLAATDPHVLCSYIKRAHVFRWVCIVLAIIVVLGFASVEIRKVIYAIDDKKNTTIGPATSMASENKPTGNEIIDMS